MTIAQVPAKIGWGGSGLNDSLKSVLDGLAGDTSLAHVQITEVTGDAAAADIAVSDLEAEDVLIGAIVIHGMGAATPAFDTTNGVGVVPSGGVTHAMSSDATPVAVDGGINIDIDTTDALVYVIWSRASLKNITPSS